MTFTPRCSSSSRSTRRRARACGANAAAASRVIVAEGRPTDTAVASSGGNASPTSRSAAAPCRFAARSFSSRVTRPPSDGPSRTTTILPRTSNPAQSSRLPYAPLAPWPAKTTSPVTSPLGEPPRACLSAGPPCRARRASRRPRRDSARSGGREPRAPTRRELREGPGQRREAGPAGEESRLVFYSDTPRRTLRSDLRHATARHAYEVVGRQPEHGLRVARGGPYLVPLEEVLVDQRRQGPFGSDGPAAPDRESRAGAHERGVRLLDRLVDEPGDLVLVHAVRAAPRDEDRLVGAPAPEDQRLHDLVHAAAERLRRVGRRPSRPIELDDAVTAAERRQRVQDALDARAHAWAITTG